MSMNLSCVRTICSDCGAEAYPSAGVVARRLGKQLTDHNAALVPQGVGCLVCGSKRVDVFNAHQDTAIVKAASALRCRVCDNFIPEPFLFQFRNADFCPLCVAADRISDAEVVAAHGTLFAGEAYGAMAMQFRGDELIQLHWLRKAVQEGDVNACSTLGDILSRSAEPSDIAEAASAYKKASDQGTPDSIVRYAQHRLALMMLQGRGVKADRDAAVSLLYSSAEKGAAYALTDLGRFILNGQFGLAPDPFLAFELFNRAHEMNPKGMMNCAAVALMLLEGIGVEPNVGKGIDKLRLAISLYAEGKPAFDADACFDQMMIARDLTAGSGSDLPSARTYLDWIAKFNVPGSVHLLDRCGGPVPPYEPRWELSLLSALPEKIKGQLWWVRSPVRNRLGQPSTLGQVERLSTKCWIATTEAGVPIGDTFDSKKDAVDVLAKALGCDVPYIDPATR